MKVSSAAIASSRRSWKVVGRRTRARSSYSRRCADALRASRHTVACGYAALDWLPRRRNFIQVYQWFDYPALQGGTDAASPSLASPGSNPVQSEYAPIAKSHTPAKGRRKSSGRLTKALRRFRRRSMKRLTRLPLSLRERLWRLRPRRVQDMASIERELYASRPSAPPRLHHHRRAEMRHVMAATRARTASGHRHGARRDRVFLQSPRSSARLVPRPFRERPCRKSSALTAGLSARRARAIAQSSSTGSACCTGSCRTRRSS